MVGTPDEVVHFAAAMQFCGFRSVVGTLWAMEDIDGCDIRGVHSSRFGLDLGLISRSDFDKARPNLYS